MNTSEFSELGAMVMQHHWKAVGAVTVMNMVMLHSVFVTLLLVCVSVKIILKDQLVANAKKVTMGIQGKNCFIWLQFYIQRIYV